MTKEHYPEVETYILYTDLRCFGKGFQEYVNRAKDDYGVERETRRGKGDRGQESGDILQPVFR